MSLPNPFSKGAPDAPDYKGAAEEQTRANRPNQATPWATSTWSQGPGMSDADLNAKLSGVPASMRGDMIAKMRAAPGAQGQWSQQVSLAPGLQSANDSMTSQLGSAWATPLDNGAQARQHAEDAIYGRETSRLNPMWDQREHDMTTTLANQGIDPGSAAYSKSLDNFGRSRNDAFSSALMDAITGGGQEASRQQQMDLTSRAAPLQAMGALKGLTSMPNVPGAGNSLAAAQAQGQYGMDAANYDRQFWADLIKGGGSAGGAALLAASDERLKADIERHPVDILPGVPLASFRYKWESEGTRHLGVIGQDLEARYPHLVVYRDGYRYVPRRFLLT